MRKLMALVASSALAVTAVPAVAQNSGLVVVDLSGLSIDALNNLAQNLKVNVSDIQALNNIAVPIGVAAAVCDVNANVLAQQAKNGGAKCTATNTSSTGFQQALQRRLGNNTQ
jgi:hypothetical protein